MPLNRMSVFALYWDILRKGRELVNGEIPGGTAKTTDRVFVQEDGPNQKKQETLTQTSFQSEARLLLESAQSALCSG